MTCDTLRGNSKLTVDPRRKDHIDSLSYGKVDATLSSSIPEVSDDINVRLNLNYHWLKEERAMALAGLYQWFQKKCVGAGFPTQVQGETTGTSTRQGRQVAAVRAHVDMGVEKTNAAVTAPASALTFAVEGIR